MTMQNFDHPPEERLAALAGADPEAAGDRRLGEHVDACTRCAHVVADLQALRSTLAELPDLAPSRPLQLVPPVHAAPERRGWLATLRGIAAPLMAAGAGLAIVGAAGLGGLAAGGMAGGAPALVDEGVDHGAMEGESAAPENYRPQASAPAATSAPQGDRSGEATFDGLTDTGTPLPWLLLLGGGGALLVAGLVLRFAINPRAG